MGSYQRMKSLAYQFSILASLFSGQGCVFESERPSGNKGQTPSNGRSSADQTQGDSSISTVPDDATITPSLVNAVQDAYAFWTLFEEFNKKSRLVSCKIDGVPTFEELTCTKGSDVAAFIMVNNYLGMVANVKARSRRAEIEGAMDTKKTEMLYNKKTNLISLTADSLEFVNRANNETVSVRTEKDLFKAELKFFTYPEGKTKATNTYSLAIDKVRKNLTIESNVVSLPGTLEGYQIVTNYDHKAAVRRSKRVGKGDSTRGTPAKTIEMVRGLQENAPPL